MKIKSLLLGSVAAAGLSTGAYAADLNVLTSLDVCDALGITGLTISSDTNCLQISGGVAYEFAWGDFDGGVYPAGVPMYGGFAGLTTYNISAAGGAAGVNNDWYNRIDAWLRFVGTADSDFGPASATLKIDFDRDTQVVNEGVGAQVGLINFPAAATPAGGATGRIRFEEAFVSVGDSTMIMSGLKGSIFNSGDDVELTWIPLYGSEQNGSSFGQAGVETPFQDRADGGPQAVIQVVTDLGNGFTAGVGLENLSGLLRGAGAAAGPAADGNFVGTIGYSGDDISAHASIVGGGFLDGVVEFWAFHGGVTGSFDMIDYVAALAADSVGNWNALASVSATFDIFTLAAAVEAASGTYGVPAPVTGSQVGFAVSGSADVTDAVTINVGGRWYDAGTAVANTEMWQLAASLEFAATETITLTGEIGWHSDNFAGGAAFANVLYGSAEVAWAPGGGYTTSLKGEANSAGAVKVTYNAAKSFN